MRADDGILLLQEHPVLLTEAPLNPKEDREKLAQMMFETFNVPALYVSMTAVLSLYASGRTTGLVLESGAGVTHAVPIFENFMVADAVQRLDLAGDTLTDYLMKMLLERGYAFSSPADRDVANDIKEKLAYVMVDYKFEMGPLGAASDNPKSLDRQYTLPDGGVITIGAELARCGEALFDPGMVGVAADGVHSAVIKAINACDATVQRDMCGNIVLGGATTLLPGLGERLAKEFTALAPCRTKIAAPPERKYSAWMGGSELASLSTFQNLWISKEEYAEFGGPIVNRKIDGDR